MMKLIAKEKNAPNTYSFHFQPESKMNWIPGQYLEWILPHHNQDNRGKNRWLTISSSPTEDNVSISTRILPDKYLDTKQNGGQGRSSFKNALLNLNIGDEVKAQDVDGDFVMPKGADEKLLWIAGGIGFTPFRAMAKYLLDTNEKRDIVLLYANKTSSDVAFADLLKKTEKIGIKTIYFSSDTPNPKKSTEFIPSDDGKVDYLAQGVIDAVAIKKHVFDWKERTFYISGPEPMVEMIEKMVSKMGITKNRIKTDFFPGYE